MNKIYYDLETTTLEIENVKILEICAYNENSLLFHYYINPNEEIKNSNIHGITNKKLENIGCFEIKYVLELFVNFINSFENPVLIAHNNFRYDQLVLEKEFKNSGITIPSNWKFFDSLPIAQFTVKKLPYGKHKLNDLYQHFFNSNIHLQHSAIGDVYALSKIYPKIEELFYFKNSILSDDFLINRFSKFSSDYNNDTNLSLINLDGIGLFTDLKLAEHNINTIFDLKKLKNNLTIDKFKEFLLFKIKINSTNLKNLLKCLDQY